MAECVLELLGTRGCHLCEQAEPLVRTAAATRGIAWRYLDIADDDALVARYAERIPVLRRLDTANEIGWPFGLLDILRFIDARN